MKKLLLLILFLSHFPPGAWGNAPLPGSQEVTLFFTSNGQGEYEPCG